MKEEEKKLVVNYSTKKILREENDNFNFHSFA